jgi:MarR family transcriptional regulator for hemolysin
MEDQQGESIGVLLSEISRVMRKRFDRRARELGLTRAQWRVLSRLRMRQGINQTTLADLIEIEPITLARHIDRLQEKGWVERRSDPNDRRAWRLYLDDSVKPILDEMHKISEWNNAAAMRDFDDEECRRFVADLYRMKATLLAAEQDELGNDSEDDPAPAQRAVQGGRHG